MSWGQNRSMVVRAAVAAATLCGLASAAPLAAEDALIVKSTVAKYPVGNKIDDKAEIILETGDVVSVLTKRGTRTMKGPGAFVVGANPKSNRARFADITRQAAANRNDAGAVRSAANGDDDRPLNPNLYYVDVDRSGPVCLRDLTMATLWRPFSAEAVTYTLSETASQEMAQTLSLSVPFDKQIDAALIDAERFRLKDGASYTISGPKAGHATSITIVDLGMDIQAADKLAETLLAKGCVTQFKLLAERLAPDD